MAAVIAVMGNPEHPLDRANGATDAGANRAADHSAYRTGDAVAFIGTLVGAAHDTLAMAGLRRDRQGKQERGSGEKQVGR